jgi:actin-like ATPase involved in cell morphogenesis
MKTSINYGSSDDSNHITIDQGSIIQEGVRTAMVAMGQEIVDTIELIKFSYGVSHSAEWDKIEITVILPKTFSDDESKRQLCVTLPRKLKSTDVATTIMNLVQELLKRKKQAIEKVNRETDTLCHILARNTGVAP